MTDSKTDILVVGGGPAGVVSALTAKRYYPDKKVTLVKKIANGCIPCGIPYMFASLKDPEENKLGTASLEKEGIQIVIDDAVKIDRSAKRVVAESGAEFSYEKLVLATGSVPMMPPVPGLDKEGVWSVYKDMDYLTRAVERIKHGKNVLILGGGFIGIEFADEVSSLGGLKVYLAEVFPRLLANSFDPEFSVLVEQKLQSKGVEIFTNTKVMEISGAGKVEKARLSNGREISVDHVILGVGAKADTRLAAEAGLDLGRVQGIWVDEYMRTSDSDIFAVGDCASKRDFYTRKNAPVLLASTAAAEARIAGANLYELKVVRENKGTIAIYSTYVNGLVLGSAGLTENTARGEGFEIAVGVSECMDKHPATLPGANKVKVKLIFSRKSGILMGGQVAGGMSCGELINLIGVAIQQRISVTELETLQIATHPYLTSAPTMYPIVSAAQEAAGKI